MLRAAALLVAALWSVPALGATVHGAVLVPRAAQVDTDRYKSPKNWEKTLRFFRRTYGSRKGIVWTAVETPPRVKAIHLANTNPRSTWTGINVYQVNSEVFMYVLAREGHRTKKAR